MLYFILIYVVTSQPSFWNELSKRFTIDSTNADYQVGRFKQIVDHNTFGQPQYFSQKFLIKSTFWKMGNPIFFYCGNEGPVEMFYENSYFLNNNLAQQYGALVLYLEHRYFGESYPFETQQESFTKEHLKFLTSAQALQDFVVFLKWFKAYNSPQSKIIAFGGSYGGMLASWLRMKFPNVVDGALAMSAPILYFKNRENLNIDIFYKLATDAYRSSSIGNLCVEIIREAFRRLQTSKNYKAINQGFKTCTPVTNSTGVRLAEEWLNVGLTYMSMTNYPYETKFLKTLPGYPCTKACEVMSKISPQSDDITLFDGVRRAAEIYFNYENLETCNEIYGDNSADSDMSGWNILACADMVMPMGSNGVDDMYNDQPFDYDGYNQFCKDTYGLNPQYDYALDYYGGVNDEDLKGYSNILFSNGMLDPWSGGSPLKNISDTVIVINMEGCAHHLDLRAPHPEDPESVKIGRLQEADFIGKILNQVPKSLAVR